MTINNPNMQVCYKNKRIYFSHAAITLLGNPTHLSVWYDEQDGVLYFAPAAPNDLDAYEIPKFYWTRTQKTCVIARIAFLKALQYRFGWNNGSKYYFSGTIFQANGVPTLAYTLTDGKMVR